MATGCMLHDAHDLMTCEACRQPVILTVENGLCPRCFYKFECEAICSAAEDEVDRILTESGPIATAPMDEPDTVRTYLPVVEEARAWGW